MSELKPELGWKPFSREQKAAREKPPWWAVALVSGLGAGAAIVAALGLSSTSAHGEQASVRTSGISAAQAAQSESETAWRQRMEQKLDFALREIGDTREKLARIEGRLERK